jgi:hypothetical protein
MITMFPYEKQGRCDFALFVVLPFQEQSLPIGFLHIYFYRTQIETIMRRIQRIGNAIFMHAMLLYKRTASTRNLPCAHCNALSYV